MKTKNPQKSKKRIIFTIVEFVLLAIMMVLLLIPMNKPEEIEYTQFLECVDKGIVETAQINSNTGVVTYTLEGDKKEYSTT